jgi:hypothetical protein
MRIGVLECDQFGEAYIRARLEDRVDRIGEEGTAAALASLAQLTDERTVAQWIASFVRARSRDQGRPGR